MIQGGATLEALVAVQIIQEAEVVAHITQEAEVTVAATVIRAGGLI